MLILNDNVRGMIEIDQTKQVLFVQSSGLVVKDPCGVRVFKDGLKVYVSVDVVNELTLLPHCNLRRMICVLDGGD